MRNSFNREQQYSYGQVMGPLKYQSNKNEYECQDKHIAGLTHQEVSELITSFPFIYYIYKKNKPNDQWKLLDILTKAPTQSDQPGFIYGFMNQQQNTLLQTPYWIKMGRTKSNPPQQRIFQWQRDDQIKITQVFTVRTLYNKKLEALVHALFAYARQNRVINGKQRKQWFRFEQITLTAAAVNILNHLMNTIHTTHLGNKPKIYLNRNLKQISQKITQSNNQLKDITNIAPILTVQSFVRDLGIQLGKNNQIKQKLSKCNSIEEGITLCRQFAIGKQMAEFFKQIQIGEKMIEIYKEKIEDYKNFTFAQMTQIYNKTKINIVVFDDKNKNKSVNASSNSKINPGLNTLNSSKMISQVKNESRNRSKSRSKDNNNKSVRSKQKQKQNLSNINTVKNQNKTNYVQKHTQKYIQKNPQYQSQSQKQRQIKNRKSIQKNKRRSSEKTSNNNHSYSHKNNIIIIDKQDEHQLQQQYQQQQQHKHQHQHEHQQQQFYDMPEQQSNYIPDYSNLIENQESPSKYTNPYADTYTFAQTYNNQNQLTDYMQKLSLDQCPPVNYNQHTYNTNNTNNIETNTETTVQIKSKGKIYSKSGIVKQVEIQGTIINQFRSNNRNLMKYKKVSSSSSNNNNDGRDGDRGQYKSRDSKGKQKKSQQKKQVKVIRNKSRQMQRQDIRGSYSNKNNFDNTYINLQQNQNYQPQQYDPNNLNQSKSEQQLQQELSNLKPKEWQVKQSTNCRLSQLQSSPIGEQLFIKTDVLYMDCSQFVIQSNFIVMARRLEYGGGSGGVNIKKGSKFKGYIRIFCREVVGNLGESVKIDRNCQKYVGIFEVRSIEQIIPVYCYQKNKQKQKKIIIDQAVKVLSSQFLAIFKYTQ